MSNKTMKRMDYSADDLEELLFSAFKKLEAAGLVDMDDPLYRWYLEYSTDLAQASEAEALAALASLSPKQRANLTEFVRATGKLPVKAKPAPPALIGHNPIVKNSTPVRRQHKKHQF